MPSQSAGERAPESVATPATEVRAPEPTPVAPHERERRSTPPIPAPRVSWRLLLLTSSDTDTYIASESATAIFRFVFFCPRVRFGSVFFCDLSTTKGKIGIRFDQAAMDRVDRAHYSEGHQIKRGAKGHFPRRHCECLGGMPHTRARARAIAATHRASQESTLRVPDPRWNIRPRVFGTSSSSRRRARVPPARLALASHDDSRRRAFLEPPERSAFRGRWPQTGRFETKGASAHRSRQDINAHIAPARSEARRLERHPSSSGAPVVVAFVVERTQPYSRRVRASSRSSKSKSISPGAPRSRRAN